MLRKRARNDIGFSLVEVLIASTLLAIGLTAAMRLFASATATNAAARLVTQATILALDKMEQLRAADMDDPAMGRSPPDALASDTEGFFDRPNPAFTRRWSIEPLPSYPDEGIVVRVVVLRTASPARAALEAIRVWKPTGGPVE